MTTCCVLGLLQKLGTQQEGGLDFNRRGKTDWTGQECGGECSGEAGPRKLENNEFSLWCGEPQGPFFLRGEPAWASQDGAGTLEDLE